MDVKFNFKALFKTLSWEEKIAARNTGLEVSPFEESFVETMFHKEVPYKRVYPGREFFNYDETGMDSPLPAFYLNEGKPNRYPITIRSARQSVIINADFFNSLEPEEVKALCLICTDAVNSKCNEMYFALLSTAFLVGLTCEKAFNDKPDGVLEILTQAALLIGVAFLYATKLQNSVELNADKKALENGISPETIKSLAAKELEYSSKNRWSSAIYHNRIEQLSSLTKSNPAISA